MKKLLPTLAAGLLLACFSLNAQNVFTSYAISTTGQINDIETDGTGNVFAAATDGVWTIGLFSKAIDNYSTSDGLPAIPAYSLSRDNSGNIFATTATKGLASFDAGQNNWSAVNLGLNQSFSYFSHVSHSHNGDRYLGTENGKVFIQANSTGTPVEKANYSNTHPLGMITSISSTQNAPAPTITVLSTNGIILDISGFVLPITSSSALPNDSVISGKMHKNVSYDGTISGLYTADFSQGAPPSVGLYTVSNSSLPSDRIQALEAFDNSVYVGTDNGLAVLSLTDNSWTVYNTTNSNLPSDDVVALTVSSSGRLWIATSDNSVSTFNDGLGEREVKMQQESVELYPNPAGNEIILDESYLKSQYQIFGVDGTLMIEGEVTKPQIDITSLKSGSYLFVITTGKGETSGAQFIKR